MQVMQFIFELNPVPETFDRPNVVMNHHQLCKNLCGIQNEFWINV